MGILIPNLLMRRATVAIGTSRTQCRGVTISGPISESKNNSEAARLEDPRRNESVTSKGATEKLERRQTLGAENAKPPIETATTSTSQCGGLKVRRTVSRKNYVYTPASVDTEPPRAKAIMKELERRHPLIAEDAKAPTETATTSTSQCGGLKIRRTVNRTSHVYTPAPVDTESPRAKALMKALERREILKKGAQDERPSPETATAQHRGPRVSKVVAPERGFISEEEVPRWRAAMLAKHKSAEGVSKGEEPPTEASGLMIYRYESGARSREVKTSRRLALKKGEDNAEPPKLQYIRPGAMFAPTRPQQDKASSRRHLTPDILNELLGEPAAEPVHPTVPPLNLTPESVGLPPDISWRPLADKDHKEFLHSDHAQNGGSSSEPLVARLRDTATVLVFSCASRTLALSDFIRLSPQGEHIEGWTSGIVRVIPGRDPATLERTNHYFLVFSTAAAAAGYAENISRLHQLAQKWTPQRPDDIGIPTPGVEIGKHSEDVGALVRSYTLLPNTQLKVHMRRLQKPYRPAMARVIETGAYHNVLAQEKDRPGENLVLFRLEEGLMSGRDLMKFIEADGRRRNLNWRLEGNAEGDIKQYGGGGKNDASRSEEDWIDEGEEDGSHDKKERRRRRSAVNMGVYPRHIVRFRDAVEAKRFVRAWHSRILEGEPWDTLAESGQWGGAKVSAEILW